MKIGLVGYRGSGKSTLFEWLTGMAPDASLAHKGQSAMAPVPDPRMDALVGLYHPKKTVYASLEIVDTPGLSRVHEGNAARLALIREAGCLVLVVSAFDGSDPADELSSFEEDLVLADMGLVSGRIERVEEALKKPLPRQEHERLVHEEETLKVVLSAMEDGRPLGLDDMTDEQLHVTRPFRLFGEKARMVLVNTADDEEAPERFAQSLPEGIPSVAIPVGLELELARMSPEDRAEFEADMGIGGSDRDELIRTMMDVSGQMLYFTASEKEVRSWMLHKGGSALEAAANVHSDLARGFIRAEVMTVSDLVRAGSEREMKAQHLVRQEPKDYVVQDDDILHIRFSV
ncbi:MAG: redox-regulated ATPase YchF [Planctomycetes bacterium]|nr:redox-regulated ATPase YchF [Planctomycetota bacterium]